MEAMQEDWRRDPDSVPESWRYFFEGLAFAESSRPEGERLEEARKARAQSNVASLMYAYRSLGHLIAQTDPLGANPTDHPAFALEQFGLSEADLESVFDTGHLKGPDRLPLREIIEHLRDTYCRSVGVEYMHIQKKKVRRWLQEQMEPVRNSPPRPRVRKLRILQSLIDAEQFESFTHSRYPGQKRFSLEGAETLIPGLRALFEHCPELGVKEVVLGMAHRGRLNVLANIFGLSYEQIFSEFEGNFLPDSVQGDGDVKYHKGYSSSWITLEGENVHLSLTANPSHLEAVDPVVEGRVRAKQRQRGDTARRRAVLPLLVHGDAAFSGQGVVAETLNLSQLPGYATGGTVHVIINNQIGFTTLPSEGRSTVYSTDVAKMIEAPIFHVNGEDPEAMVFAMKTALRYRDRFASDVVVDMVCYRRHGHNEGDDPGFTQPVLYDRIQERPPVRLIYMRQLVEEGTLRREEAQQMVEEFREELESAHAAAKKENPHVQIQAFADRWRGLDAPFSFDDVDTSVDRARLTRVARALCTVPEGYHLNRKVARQLPKRLEAVQQGGDIDWPFAELLSFGTLLDEGIPVRLSGQDSARGTFSQRHSVWQDADDQQRYVPLNNLSDEQARFCVYNSSLAEASVLGFEYGYSLSEPNMLIMWEAQFGDFSNGAQVIIDQFITGAESKWQRDSAITLLLPHGYEGQGPEHSSAYLERFLQSAAENNVSICNPTTPAQYFHLLRRQIARDFRMPLVVMTPKSMLRHKRAVSPVAALLDGGFEEVLSDPQPPASARRLVLCSGKFYWDLVERREQIDSDEVAIVRIEQLYPLNEQKLRAAVEPHRGAEEVIWAQEEPQNRGAWSFMFPRLLELFGDKRVGYVGREASASAATGSLRRHREEQQAVVEAAVGSVGAKDTSSKEDDEDRHQGTICRRIDHGRYFARVV